MITHGHPDHFVDVVPAFYARHYGGLGAPDLPFYSPEGFVEACQPARLARTAAT